MIYGIGVDIVRVERMKIAHEKWGDTFFKKILSADEISYCFKKSDPYPSLAVRFAAKEAVIKAIGAEINVRLKDVEVTNNDKGRPSVIVRGELQDFFNKNNIKQTHLSLSHEKKYAVASVVLES